MEEKQNNLIVPKDLKKIPINYWVATELLKYVIDNPDNPVITYGKLVEKLHIDFNPRNLDKPLGVISSICKENNLPPISGVVVNGELRLPGEGFYKEFFPGRPVSEWEEIYKNNLFSIKNCTVWKEFLDAIDK